MRDENFKLWIKGNEINNAEIWKLQEGLYEIKRKCTVSDGYFSPVFFVWDIKNDRQIVSTLNYQEAVTAWQNMKNSAISFS